MSAAALIAHQQFPQPDPTPRRIARSRRDVKLISGRLGPFGVSPIKGRVSHQLPCEP